MEQETVGKLNNLGAYFFIIKEVANNLYIRRKRKGEFDVKLYSLADYEKIYPDYKIIRIYSPKFIFKIENPNSLILKFLNFMFPTYTLILKRK